MVLYRSTEERISTNVTSEIQNFPLSVVQILLVCFQVDAFLIADKHIRIIGSNKKSFSLSESCNDVVAHGKLSDEQVHTSVSAGGGGVNFIISKGPTLSVKFLKCPLEFLHSTLLHKIFFLKFMLSAHRFT
jgi:hypothetical protein